MSGPTASNPLAVCDALKGQVQSCIIQHHIEAAANAKGELKRRRAQRTPKGSSGRTLFSKFTSPEQSYAAALRQDTQHQQPQAPQTDGKSVWHPVQQHLPQQEIQKTGLSVQAPSSINDTLKIATVVQLIVTELSEAASEKDKLMVITRMVLNKMAARGYRPLNAFNANGILRRRYELSKQLQDLHIDVALLSETHLKPMRGSSLQIITYLTDHFSGRKRIPITMYTYNVCAIRVHDKGEAYS
jgi:hypothetical protein